MNLTAAAPTQAVVPRFPTIFCCGEYPNAPWPRIADAPACSERAQTWKENRLLLLPPALHGILVDTGPPAEATVQWPYEIRGKNECGRCCS